MKMTYKNHGQTPFLLGVAIIGLLVLGNVASAAKRQSKPLKKWP